MDENIQEINPNKARCNPSKRPASILSHTMQMLIPPFQILACSRFIPRPIRLPQPVIGLAIGPTETI